MNPDLVVGALAVLFAGLVILVPVLGLTLRFAIKPFFDSWAEIQRNRLSSDREDLLVRQMNVLEGELQQVQSVLGSLVEAQEFQRQLATPLSPGLSDAADAGNGLQETAGRR